MYKSSTGVVSGIYLIKNTVNGKSYIGSSVNLNSRLRDHFSALRRNTHHSIKLQRAWNKYGEDSFKVIIIEYIKDLTRLVPREQLWMDAVGSATNGYNMIPTAGSQLGRVVSEETRQKLREANLGKKYSAETNAKKVHLGFKHTEESKQLISERSKGKKLGNRNGAGNKGRITSDEAKAKIAEGIRAHYRNLKEQSENAND